MGAAPTEIATLIDLPTTHLRRDVGRLVKANVRQVMIDALGDEMGHALVVAHGNFVFRDLFQKEFGAFYHGNRIHCDTIADYVFRFLEVQWRHRHPGVSPKAFLDSINEISPPTEREIDDAWTVEIASDERSMAKHYEGSARMRKGNDLGTRRFD